MTENAVAPAPPDDDRTPTQADADPLMPADEWVMPEPVFRRSDGVTPRGTFTGNEDETVTPDSIADASSDETANNTAISSDPPLIAEQPDVIDESEVSQDNATDTLAPVESKQGRSFRLLLIILGVAVVVMVLAAIVTAIMLGYVFQVSESQNLN
jgi:hypothetical protein